MLYTCIYKASGIKTLYGIQKLSALVGLINAN